VPVVPLIISKIESTEALQNFDAILEASDAIMVARGDLAVEIPMEVLTNVQKNIIYRSNLAGFFFFFIILYFY
jgi:pyruvate kinase